MRVSPHSSDGCRTAQEATDFHINLDYLHFIVVTLHKT